MSYSREEWLDGQIEDAVNAVKRIADSLERMSGQRSDRYLTEADERRQTWREDQEREAEFLRSLQRWNELFRQRERERGNG